MSEHEPELTGADRELEEALSSLSPVAAGPDSHAMLYRAGFEAGQRRTRPWRYLASTLAAALMLSLFLRPAPRVQERIVLVQAPAAREQSQSVGPDTRLAMNEVLVDRAERNDWWSRINRFWTAGHDSVRRESYFGVTPTPAQPSQADSPLLRQMRLQRTLGVDPADLGGTYRIQSSFGAQPL